MAMGRGSCIKVVLLAFLLIFWSPSHALGATHAVGDSQGWGLSVSYDNWAGQQSFSAGDTLVFTYQSGVHSVVPVNAAGYRSCQVPAGASTVATSGNDAFILKKGANYFICGMPGHCSAGMKIKVRAV